MTLSEAIKKIRKERFLSQEDFAKDPKQWNFWIYARV